jgi:hypothetical protein
MEWLFIGPVVVGYWQTMTLESGAVERLFYLHRAMPPDSKNPIPPSDGALANLSIL